MLTTEADAAKKWCPQVRASMGEDDNNAANSGVLSARNPEYARCIASSCMFWRWGEWLQMGEAQSSVVTSAPTRGYCGMAGQPA